MTSTFQNALSISAGPSEPSEPSEPSGSKTTPARFLDTLRFALPTPTLKRRPSSAESHMPQVSEEARRMAEIQSHAVKKAKLTYDPRSWLRAFRMLDVRRQSSFLFVPWLLYTLLATACTLLGHFYPIFLDATFSSEISALSLGGAMSMLLAFRLQAAYGRWSDARTLWGQVINGARSLLTQIIANTAAHKHDIVNAEDSPSSSQVHSLHQQVGGWTIAFAVALKYHLRGETLPTAPGGGNGRDDGLYKLLTPSQLAHLSHSTHPPLYAMTRLRYAVEVALSPPILPPSRRAQQHQAELRSHAMAQQLFSVTESMLQALAGCERILRTPLPPGYVGVLRVLMLFFLTLLPFSLLGCMQYCLPPVCSLMSYLVLEVEEVAVQIEQPFGFEYNDLPIDAYCLTVQADVLRLLDESRHVMRTQGRASTRLGSQTMEHSRWTSGEEISAREEYSNPLVGAVAAAPAAALSAVGEEDDEEKEEALIIGESDLAAAAAEMEHTRLSRYSEYYAS